MTFAITLACRNFRINSANQQHTLFMCPQSATTCAFGIEISPEPVAQSGVWTESGLPGEIDAKCNLRLPNHFAKAMTGIEIDAAKWPVLIRPVTG